MKVISAIFITFICCAAGFAQAETTERDFEKNRLNYKLEKYAMGEDASSGYDYLVYTSKGSVVKVREVWSSLSYTTYRVADYYFKDGKPVALIKYTFPKKYYNSAKKGAPVPLKVVERMTLSGSKLTNWTENGKIVPKNDARWSETETQIVESAGYLLEGYQNFKAEKWN